MFAIAHSVFLSANKPCTSELQILDQTLVHVDIFTHCIVSSIDPRFNQNLFKVNYNEFLFFR